MNPSGASDAWLELSTAIRYNKRAEVQALLKAGKADVFETDSETICAFDVACSYARWAIAFDLFAARVKHPAVLLEPTEEESEEESDGIYPHARVDTKEKYAYNRLLRALRQDRPVRSLGEDLLAPLRRMALIVAGQEGAEVTLIRTLVNQPVWFDAVPWLLEAGARPNAHVLNASHQATHALSEAGARGLMASLRSLLKAGADPLWKHHDWATPAHLTANWRFRPCLENGSPDLNAIERRIACFEAMLKVPGVDQVRNFQGKTPLEVLEQSRGWLKKQADPSTSPEKLASYREQKLHLTLEHVPKASPRPRM